VNNTSNTRATIATSPYAYEVVSRVVHLRDFFVTLFFVGLGMSIPVSESVAVIALSAAVAALAVLLRSLVVDVNGRRIM
jgi:Kef-type K+ transport system membrane component KefB